MGRAWAWGFGFSVFLGCASTPSPFVETRRQEEAAFRAYEAELSRMRGTLVKSPEHAYAASITNGGEIAPSVVGVVLGHRWERGIATGNYRWAVAEWTFTTDDQIADVLFAADLGRPGGKIDKHSFTEIPAPGGKREVIYLDVVATNEAIQDIASAVLVAAEVNGGKGGLGNRFTITRMRIVDGSKEFPPRLEELLGRMRLRFDERIAENEARISESVNGLRAELVPGGASSDYRAGSWWSLGEVRRDRLRIAPFADIPILHVTWLTKERRVRATFIHSRRFLVTITGPRPHAACAPGAPCAQSAAPATAFVFGVQLLATYEAGSDGTIEETKKIGPVSFREEVGYKPLDY